MFRCAPQRTFSKSAIGFARTEMNGIKYSASIITDRINIKLAIGEVMIETGTTSSGIRPMNSVRIGITHSAAETETAIRLTMKFNSHRNSFSLTE